MAVILGSSVSVCVTKEIVVLVSVSERVSLRAREIAEDVFDCLPMYEAGVFEKLG